MYDHSKIAGFRQASDAKTQEDRGKMKRPKEVWPKMQELLRKRIALKDALERDKTPKSFDLGDLNGVSWIPRNVDPVKGIRSYAGNSYYGPNAGRTNLILLTGAQATKIVFNTTAKNISAIGVQYIMGGTSYNANATKEVILSAGTFQIPHLLELSGVGNTTILGQYNIPSVLDLPGVGQNLMDHPFTGSDFLFPPWHVNTDLRVNATFRVEQQNLYTSEHKGALTYTSAINSPVTLQDLVGTAETNTLIKNLTAFLSTIPQTPLQKVQYQAQLDMLKVGDAPFLVMGALPTGGFLGPADFNTSYTMAIIMQVIRPTRSAGAQWQCLVLLTSLDNIHGISSQHIGSSDPLAAPIINPHYLGVPFEVDISVKAQQWAQRWFLSKTVGGALNLPASDVKTGTSAMVPLSMGGVVDSNLKVYGLQNVRVIDAGIFPLTIGTVIQQIVYAIAEQERHPGNGIRCNICDGNTKVHPLISLSRGRARLIRGTSTNTTSSLLPLDPIPDIMNLQNFRLRLRLCEIETLLVQIDDEIHQRSKNRRLLKERQRRLNNEKTAIQQSIDLIVYPILTIPVEITSEIFLHCLPDEPQRPSVSAAPMLLGAVCREWRVISRGDRRLWATMKIDFTRGHRFVEEWLLRAGNMPLSLTLILSRAHERCRALFSFEEEPKCDCPPLPIGLFAGSWEHLTTFRGDFFTPNECLALLARAARLTRCEFRNIEETEDFLPATVTPFLLNRLEYLGLASHPDYEYETSCLPILQSLDLPRLRTLDLHCYFPFNDASFISFLRRSPDIQIFTARFDGPDDGPDDGVANSVFSAMPSLTTLGLHLDTDDIFFQVLPLLATSHSFLPSIHALTFSVFIETLWSDTRSDILVDALAARWEPPAGVARLRDFEFNFYLDTSDEENDGQPYGIAEHLWELMAEGMKLHIGPPEASWVTLSAQDSSPPTSTPDSA
ncbi:hypothetical protein B0H17DRAFT_1177509 [Mycena rosella]|uniref:F-box domain-containing protein n=1 Tax=Mycena rosella TaxID=1033263 RepID=A0AAD7DSJ2_MYCRO|nr:hypothetical protein B0H17DRAFT_1177509 [Mycena rosella]